MWEIVKGLFSSSKGEKSVLGGVATDIREAIKGKEIDPNKLVDVYLEIAKLQSNIITTEIQGNFLQRSWRPILMLSIVFIVVNNYIMFPYFPNTFEVLELPEHLWTLLEIGLGGYVVGRSAEKAMAIYKKK